MPLSPSIVLKARERVGRSCRLRVNGVVIAVCRTKTILVNNPSIDITADIDNGVRRLHNESAEVSVGLTVEGVYSTELEDQLNPMVDNVLDSAVFDYGDMTIAGFFKRTQYKVTKQTDDAVMFTASYISTRPVIKG